MEIKEFNMLDFIEVKDYKLIVKYFGIWIESKLICENGKLKLFVLRSNCDEDWYEFVDNYKYVTKYILLDEDVD